MIKDIKKAAQEQNDGVALVNVLEQGLKLEGARYAGLYAYRSRS